ncbi:hypothetical protein [Rufibacter sp. LB8]|uniref:hypothetical protein n=1 Tax=Rufibacter sp. LB8 TaxID=2777781 RepID=UPI00178C52DE|nr:hypothetical protein [Rufibacter sp. LB8]
MAKFSKKRSKRVFVSVDNRIELLAAFDDALSSSYNDVDNSPVNFTHWYRRSNLIHSSAYKAEYQVFLKTDELRDSLFAHINEYAVDWAKRITTEELKIYMRKERIAELFKEE